MKEKFSRYLKISALYARKFRYNQNVGAFLIFLFLSTIFWFLNELENEYVTKIAFPVNYTEPPKERIFVGDLPSHLDLQIRGTGFKLLEYKLGKDFMPIDFPVSSYNLESPGKGQQKYFILTRSIRSLVSQELDSEVEIVDIDPDTLYFEFARRGSKPVPVIANIDYKLSKQLMLKNNIQIDPDTVLLSGPKTVLDTVDEVKTKNENLGEIKETTTENVYLEEVHPQVEYDERKIKLTIPVEQFTEGELRKEIVIKNAPDSLILRTFPKDVQITYLVGLSKYENVIPELFKVTVDFNETKRDAEKLTVKVENAPKYLKSYNYSPHKVEYIIEKKNE